MVHHSGIQTLPKSSSCHKPQSGRLMFTLGQINELRIGFGFKPNVGAWPTPGAELRAHHWPESAFCRDWTIWSPLHTLTLPHLLQGSQRDLLKHQTDQVTPSTKSSCGPRQGLYGTVRNRFGLWPGSWHKPPKSHVIWRVLRLLRASFCYRGFCAELLRILEFF